MTVWGYLGRRQQALATLQEELEAQCSLAMDATQRAEAAEQDLSDFRCACAAVAAEASASAARRCTVTLSCMHVGCRMLWLICDGVLVMTDPSHSPCSGITDGTAPRLQLQRAARAACAAWLNACCLARFMLQHVCQAEPWLLG